MNIIAVSSSLSHKQRLNLKSVGLICTLAGLLIKQCLTIPILDCLCSTLCKENIFFLTGKLRDTYTNSSEKQYRQHSVSLPYTILLFRLTSKMLCVFLAHQHLHRRLMSCPFAAPFLLSKHSKIDALANQDRDVFTTHIKSAPNFSWWVSLSWV